VGGVTSVGGDPAKTSYFYKSILKKLSVKDKNKDYGNK